MELLGQYQSSLTQFYYQELLAVLNSAVSAGDLAGGSAFSQSTLTDLETDAQSFSQLTIPAANSRTTDDSINYPLSLLLARLNSIQSEVNNFTTVSSRLLDVLYNETKLIDQLLAADSLAQYKATLPIIKGAWSQAWDFSVNQGPVYIAIPQTNPSNEVIYETPQGLIPTAAVFNTTTGALSAGLVNYSVDRTVHAKSLQWTCSAGDITQDLYDPAFTWAQLDIINDEPAVQFSNPSAQVILPVGVSNISNLQLVGQVPGGVLPTYLRLLFYPRANSKTITVTNGVPAILSSYNIDPNVLNLLSADGSIAYTLDSDFTANQIGTITPIDIGTSVSVTAYFTEYWPAYQCSLDQVNWSQIVMLDQNRLYPDGTTTFLPIALQNLSSTNVLFPLMDDTGAPTGIYFKLLSYLQQEYTILVTTPATASYVYGQSTCWGPTAVLEIDSEQPSYMTAVSVNPYCQFPMTLISVALEGLTSNTKTTVWNGSLLMEQATQIQFPRQIVSKIFLTFVQNSYTIKEYQEVTTDTLRSSIMNTVESTLPVTIPSSSLTAPVVSLGYQYEWGVEDIVILDIGYAAPSVFVQGPFIITGVPDVVRFDAVFSGTENMITESIVDTFVVYKAYTSSGSLDQENLDGFYVGPGLGTVWPWASSTSSVAYVEVGLRFVLESNDSIVSRYQIQATLK